VGLGNERLDREIAKADVERAISATPIGVRVTGKEVKQQQEVL